MTSRTLIFKVPSRLKTVSLLLALAFPLSISYAGSATWSANPTSGDWNTAGNWVPSTVPNSEFDIATFGQSTVTNLSLSSGSVSLDSIVYDPGASPYTITTVYANLSLYGSGIVNNSGIEQSLKMGENLIMFFYDSSTAGEMTSLGGPGGSFIFNDNSSAGSGSFSIASTTVTATLAFEDSSTAADATITVSNYTPVDFFGDSTAANAVVEADAGGFLYFGDNATADHIIATFNSEGNEFVGSGVQFQQSATAANGAFTADGATSSTGFASYVTFFGASTAGNATFVLKGGSAGGAAGTVMDFFNTSKANNATITVNGGTNGGEGASVIFHSGAKGGTARFILGGNGTFDISNHNSNPVTTGSIEGSGVVLLGARQLAVGSNNLTTTFAGSIQDGSNGSGGSLSKIGTGTLTLSGANIYTGGTTVEKGTLLVRTKLASATGTGPVQVNGGTLGGRGKMAGAVTIGSGSGSGALLIPGLGATKPTTLSVQSSLTWQSDGTLQERLNTHSAQADGAAANGVTINPGAQFTLQTIGQKKLVSGTVFTMISNTSANPISGTFANLADGATLVAGPNTLVADYSGGDGNDLTLTVQ